MTTATKLTAAQQKVMDLLVSLGGTARVGFGRSFPPGMNGNAVSKLQDMGLVEVHREVLGNWHVCLAKK